MFHMSLPYGKACDSDHYSICTKASATEHSWRDREQDREDDVGVVQGKGMAVIEAGTCLDHIRILASVPPKTRRVGVSGIPEGEKFAYNV